VRVESDEFDNFAGNGCSHGTVPVVRLSSVAAGPLAGVVWTSHVVSHSMNTVPRTPQHAEGTVAVDTAHPTRYTLHPTPHTLHPTRYTLHPAPYTPQHPTPYTLQLVADNVAVDEARILPRGRTTLSP